MISAHIGQVTATIDVTNDIGTKDCTCRVKRIVAIAILNRISIVVKISQIHRLSNLITNVNRSISFNAGFVATAKDTTLNWFIILVCISATYRTKGRGSFSIGIWVIIYIRFSVKLVDVYLRVTIDSSTSTISSSEHLTDTGTRIDIHLGIVILSGCLIEDCIWLVCKSNNIILIGYRLSRHIKRSLLILV